MMCVETELYTIFCVFFFRDDLATGGSGSSTNFLVCEMNAGNTASFSLQKKCVFFVFLM